MAKVVRAQKQRPVNSGDVGSGGPGDGTVSADCREDGDGDGIAFVGGLVVSSLAPVLLKIYLLSAT
jgi:hypothetical protein